MPGLDSIILDLGFCDLACPSCELWALGGEEPMSVCFSTVTTTKDNCHGREDDGKYSNKFSAANTS